MSQREAVSPESSLPTVPGDLVVMTRRSVGDHERFCEILEVLGDPAHPHYRVRWNDGHEGTLYPGSDATIRHAARRKQRQR